MRRPISQISSCATELPRPPLRQPTLRHGDTVTRSRRAQRSPSVPRATFYALRQSDGVPTATRCDRAAWQLGATVPPFVGAYGRNVARGTPNPHSLRDIRASSVHYPMPKGCCTVARFRVPEARRFARRRSARSDGRTAKVAHWIAPQSRRGPTCLHAAGSPKVHYRPHDQPAKVTRVMP